MDGKKRIGVIERSLDDMKRNERKTKRMHDTWYRLEALHIGQPSAGRLASLFLFIVPTTKLLHVFLRLLFLFPSFPFPRGTVDCRSEKNRL